MSSGSFYVVNRLVRDVGFIILKILMGINIVRSANLFVKYTGIMQIGNEIASIGTATDYCLILVLDLEPLAFHDFAEQGLICQEYKF